MTFCQSKILSELSILENLTEIDLSYSDVSFVDFSFFKILKKLKIQHSKIDLKLLKDLKTLKELDLSSSTIIEHEDTISSFNELEKLNLSFCIPVWKSMWIKWIPTYQFLIDLNIAKFDSFSRTDDLQKLFELPSLKFLTVDSNKMSSKWFLENYEKLPKNMKISIL